MNPNKALWEKGDFTRIAETMRESGEALVAKIGVNKDLEGHTLLRHCQDKYGNQTHCTGFGGSKEAGHHPADYNAENHDHGDKFRKTSYLFFHRELLRACRTKGRIDLAPYVNHSDEKRRNEQSRD